MKRAKKYAVYSGCCELRGRQAALKGDDLDRAAFDGCMEGDPERLGVYSTLFDAKAAADGMECDLWPARFYVGSGLCGSAVWVEEVEVDDDGDVCGIVEILWVAPWSARARSIIAGTYGDDGDGDGADAAEVPA